MPLYEAEAIVLRQYALSDSDRIIVFITKEFGKIRAAAKGVKKPKSRAPAAISVLLKQNGVLMNAINDRQVRAVTHYDVTREDCAQALAAVAEVVAS